MTNLAFSILYSICLAFCVGVLEMVRFGLPLPDEVPPPQPVEEVAIAVPPRPEGVREVTGEGDEVYRRGIRIFFHAFIGETITIVVDVVALELGEAR